MRITTPLRASLFNESQSGTARLAALSRFLVANWRAALEFLISMTSFTLRPNEGMLTLRPLTLTWPWDTNWRAAARVLAKPR